MDELKQAAFEYLLFHPGTEFEDWQQGLIEYCPTEVVDAFGNNPDKVYADLTELWESDVYEDKATGECRTFCEWADYFATDQSIELYNLSTPRVR